MSAMLYQHCDVCRSRGQILKPNGGQDAEMISCVACHGSGYWPTGVTLGQLNRMVEIERCLQGDPSIDGPRARFVLSRLMEMSENALRRLGQ